MARYAIVIGYLAFSLLNGCSTVPAPTANSTTLNELFIKNKTTDTIIDVTLNVPNRGKSVSCSLISSGYDCSLGFPAIKFENNPVVLSWSQGGRAYRKLLPKIQNSEIQENRNLKAVVTILNNGKLEFILE